MPLRPCLDCGGLSDGPRCPEHQALVNAKRNARKQPHRVRRPEYTSAERTRRADTVRAWVDAYGYVCPGWKRPAHAADPKRNPLTADHPQAVRSGGTEAAALRVLCRSCNSRKGSHSVTG